MIPEYLVMSDFGSTVMYFDPAWYWSAGKSFGKFKYNTVYNVCQYQYLFSETSFDRLLNFATYKQIVLARCDKQAWIAHIFSGTKIILFADSCLLILLVLTETIFKIEILPKELSAIDEITTFWFTKLVELNLQKHNLNFLICFTSIFSYLYYHLYKMEKKCKTNVIFVLYLLKTNSYSFEQSYCDRNRKILRCKAFITKTAGF